MAVTSRKLRAGLVGWCLLFIGAGALAGVLPEDRADAMYHYYDGGGVQIDGPSLLMRKSVGQSFSFFGNYYEDSISSASIDVVTTASPYDETRTEYSLGFDYLRGDTTMSFAYGNSEEDDYEANTFNFGIAQDIFSGMTTVTLGYGKGNDTVMSNVDPDFEADMDRQSYRLGVSQVITRNMLASINYEVVTDEGFLNNPYRSVRYLDPTSGSGYSFQPERYPNTRTSNAVGVRSRYFLPYRAALHGGYRYFTDDWEIDAHNADVGYTQPIGPWTFEVGYRYYTQSAAEFFSDLFPYEDAQNFLARDKELSSFDSHTVQAGVSYDFIEGGWSFLEKGTLNVFYDHVWFSYDDFRDLRNNTGVIPGQEPTYEFEADILQLFVSFWF
ncbi:MAG: DUF3570 domain-containing protein [Chromatiales bacterium]|nr:MAG: DUF3570 domain-containing protein [Chromatiales bacterium]